MGAMKEEFMDLIEQIEKAEDEDDVVVANLLHAIMALRNVVSRLNLSRTNLSGSVKEVLDLTVVGIENDIAFLEKIVAILNNEKAA